MKLPITLAWLLDEASTATGADHFLAALGAQLIADDLPLAGGALTLAAPHPMIVRRTWLWRAETGVVIEALGFGALGSAAPGQSDVGRDWLTRLGGAVVQDVAGPASDGPVLGWSISRPLTEQESALLRQAVRFAAAPLAALVTRSPLAALLEAYLGRRSAAQVLAGRLRRQTGETIRAVLLYGDLRDFTALSEAMAPEAVVTALGAVGAARAGMTHLDQARERQGLPPLRFGAALHLGEMLWGNIGTADRLDFTAIGPAVNLVSRLEGLCRPLGRSVLISGAVAAETNTRLIPLGEHDLRGIATPCAVFTLPED